MRIQPNFCSLAGQAEDLLRRFQAEGDPPTHVFVHATMSKSFCWSLSHSFWMLLSFLPEAEGILSPASADQEPDEEGPDDEDSGCENPLDQSGIMDFSAAAIAEQLTRTDSVRVSGFLTLHTDTLCCSFTRTTEGWWAVSVIFQALFAKVVPYQCLGCVWSQRDKKENMSPTIRATIAQFNAITNQVIMSLLCQPKEPTSSPTSSPSTPTTSLQRARTIEKWIKVAQVSQSQHILAPGSYQTRLCETFY